ncbi:heme A synthase [Nocardioides sp. CFH 31398]|uniref:COX15/CtaA family protein n=1 Tax=Nocardioides sp. CFH 31398 TaxID=2919579 RepID=UPI001F065263|nr:COX15/CtaA family protein [Nocardioides sp. CFH 31398]MCH1866745.1 COX15/CtaA family protein [Nocardioides sp. CFH 31398]
MSTLLRPLDRLVPWLWPLAVADLVANVLIVVTGGAVRLTASGLGCPTWPRCSEESYVSHGELGLHGAIEFGNRLLTFAVALVAVLTLLAAWRSGRRRASRLALVVFLGIPAQAVLGGVTVLTQLNPWIVALHFLVSMAIIAVCVLLLDELRGPERGAAPLPVRRATLVVFALGWLSLYLGTVVTGSGPHAGDLDARRTGLDPQWMSHVHAWSVYALVAATVVLLVLARRAGAARVAAATGLLLGLELAQGVVGFVQYFTDLPVVLVAIHMLGAALISASLTAVVLSARPLVRRRTRTPVDGSTAVTT